MSTPAPALPTLTGGCLCGAVRYEATPSHREGYYCHCRMCQLAVGNTRAAWINLRKDEVRWLAEPAHFASSKIARRSFCGRCGTPLAFAFHDSEYMDLSVGSLDDPSALKPVAHYSVETRIAGWHAADGLPEHRLDTNERIAQRWRDAYGDAPPGLDTARGG
ncbi:MAG: GFA family protein [Burkholderiaceae bacterium]